MRISGLASGMDIDSMVSQLMKAQSMGLDKLKQKKQILEWQRDDYRSMNTLLLDFRSQLTQMKLTTNYRSRQTTSTNDARLTATASSAASISSYTISNVTQLASAETRVTDNPIYKLGSTFDAAKGIYGQNSSLKDTDPSVWKVGAILSSSVNTSSDNMSADGKSITIEDMKNVDIDQLHSFSVQVNGIGYKVVSQEEVGARPLEDDEVILQVTDDGKGTLQFANSIAKDSAVKIDYVAENRTESSTLTKDTMAMQLSQGAINSITDVTLNVIDKDGKSVDTKKFTVEGTVLKDANGKEVGTVAMDTGIITFNKDFPLPAEDADTISTLSVTYDHQYTDFSMDTSTSNGERHANFLISGSESLNSVISKINNSSVGATMFYDSFTGKFSLTRSETGNFNTSNPDGNGNDANEMATSGDFINKLLGFDNSDITVKGQNAKLSINGLETERTSNTFEMNGVTFTIKQTFSDHAESISISNNTDTIFNNIKDFVTKYNDLIGKIQSKIDEDRDRDYAPLTDDQREQLSDTQQEQWEDKAKSGLLKNDSTLSSVLYGMRSNFSQSVMNDKVSSVFNQLSKIGITTTANYLEGGKLEIDEAALKKAIETDPDSVENLFRGDGVTSDQKGIVQRLYDTVSNTMDTLKLKAGNANSVNDTFTLGKQLDNVGDQIDAFEDKLTQMEDRYYSQFTAMEQAIQQFNSQSAYLSNYFSS